MVRFTLMLFLMVFPLSGSDAIAFIKSLKNSVSIDRNHSTLSIQKSGEELFSGDVIQSGSHSSASIIFNDGTVVTLGSKSILRIDDFLFKPAKRQYNFELSLNKGSATFDSGKIGKAAPESVTFKVPEGTIGIRGTHFYVEVP